MRTRSTSKAVPARRRRSRGRTFAIKTSWRHLRAGQPTSKGAAPTSLFHTQADARRANCCSYSRRLHVLESYLRSHNATNSCSAWHSSIARRMHRFTRVRGSVDEDARVSRPPPSTRHEKMRPGTRHGSNVDLTDSHEPIATCCPHRRRARYSRCAARTPRRPAARRRIRASLRRLAQAGAAASRNERHLQHLLYRCRWHGAERVQARLMRSDER